MAINLREEVRFELHQKGSRLWAGEEAFRWVKVPGHSLKMVGRLSGREQGDGADRARPQSGDL